VYTCIAGGCGISHVAAGTVVSSQTAGDCRVNTCDGTGGVVPTTDDADVPGDDGSPCTVETCAAGLPASVASPAGLSCGGSGLCDGAGVCVGCLAASDCPGQDSACAQRACVVGVCQMLAAPAGTPVPAQQAGDCQRNQCDGAGQVQSVADDAGLPVDGNQCTADLCSAGVPVNSNLATGTSCAQGGGSSCDGAGKCVSSTFRVLRVGDGTLPLNSAGAFVFVDERRTDGSLVGTVALPSAASGANQPFTMSGSASSEGQLSLSGDGRYLVIPGYAAAPTTAGVASTTAAAIKRSVARIDAAGNVDTSTMLLTAFNANNVRGATSFDGSGFWVAGAGGATGGVWFVPLGTTGGVQVLGTPNNIRWVQVVGTQLYGTSNQTGLANVFTVGTGLPALVGQAAAMFPGMPTNNNPSPFGFVLLDLLPGVGNATGADTLYVADDRAAPTGGVQKWTFNGTTWVLAATLNVATTPIGFRGLAGSAAGGKVTLIGTTADSTNTRLVVFVDDGASVTSAVVATAPANVLYRGVALSPAP
jgi:hypothetical protein